MTKTSGLMPLAADFPDQDEARWRALAEAALKGAPWDRLVARTADGVSVQPLYRETDIATAGDPSGAPGQAPFVRGGHATRDAFLPWQIRQSVEAPEPEAAQAEVMADLERGASSIELVVDPAGAGGVKIASPADLKTALDGVLVDLAPIALDAGAAGLATAKLLAEFLKDAGPAAAPPAFNIDPVGALMREGAIADGALKDAAAFAATQRDRFPKATWLRADARLVHEAGGSEAQEIAAALSSGIASLRALTDAGFPIDDAGGAILFTVSVGPDILVETAKLRALRLTWARVMEASGAKPEARAAQIHAVTSRRMMTRHDAWTNMLRTTAAAFAAAVGGAEAITVLPFTDALGRPTPFSRRIARNTQLILMEESHLGHVIDPAGGAWFVEKLTRDLAEEAWKEMQGIEAQGGIIAALTNGVVQHEVELIRQKRQKAFATRRESVTGVTDFPLLGAELPATQGARAFRPASDASLKARAPVLSPIRWAEPFETLRDKGEAAKASAFFATLGPLAEFSARANFATNLLAAGGVGAIGSEDVYADAAALGAAFAKSGATVAVLCGSDARYASDAASAAQALKAAGALWIVYAGKPADEAAMRTAGVDQFIFAGQDALEALKTLHAALGVV
ncbi:MAG: methylmalonyl-CoA mutase subunit beta [Hyphomonadaceae bacterium]|nr:MAG: methylmalonyl-CoA mutase [Caulobacteraceae bacterium]MBT9445752.1 methylmalonyl-CoA mutase subunit beta [Hyphomonadaceae bacterium]TPW07256.1 MAG: methylmalonyl-CoA mutase [Alphaproteobacteria bacterium]